MAESGTDQGLRLAIGLMSGTSLDAIDVAAIRTDGVHAVQFGPALSIPYADDFRERLRCLLGAHGANAPELGAIEAELTELHANAVRRLLASSDLDPADVDVIGFHGHTIFHDPANAITRQIGDGQSLADQLGIDVVADFRSADVGAGGQGAPLVPVYHQTLARGTPGLDVPLCVLNLGGISNVTWIGPETDDLLAFDGSPCNALLDDWVRQTTGDAFDKGGALALSGVADDAVVTSLLDHAYFKKPVPKSLDRLDFGLTKLEGLSPEDGAATLVAFIANAQHMACEHFPSPPKVWIVCGGGRHNAALMAALVATLDGAVKSGEDVGWDGDALEAQAFAYLAVRSIEGLPISFPSTTGVREPMTGGRFFKCNPQTSTPRASPQKKNPPLLLK